MNQNKTTAAPSVAAETGDGSGDEPGSSRALVPLNLKPQLQPSLWSRLVRLIRGGMTQHPDEELNEALGASGAGATFRPEERAMLDNILKLRVLRVEDVMVPRADIRSVDQSVTLGELLEIFEESGHSRMPVYGDSLDDPRGMVHIRDFLAHITKQARGRRRSPASNGAAAKADNGGAASTRERPRKVEKFDLARVDLNKTVHEAGLVRDVLFVPPSMLASDLMQKMQATRTQMALVIDEYGGTDGLVSLEDIVETVVGDIEDEHDDEAEMISRQSEDVFIADAKAELDDIAEVIGGDFDVGDKGEEVDTLGGLIFSILGRIPARGEVVKALPHFEFHVLEADPRRIRRVRIVRQRVAERRRRPVPVKVEADNSNDPVPPQPAEHPAEAQESELSR
ncbi:hemolysin family protein [Hoeflea sp. WL0058]|uniref:Hemolysin family protein n=1 Tax=Flavimaribacter sediminis TaxID=2865987 RepID=A0AAE3D1H4_9HYPH|nr:hemolysin family protein [Flavimaribacter sediminis]MBW8637941.1 hemolysin family protein [Flavimaribacter sediminis]